MDVDAGCPVCGTTPGSVSVRCESCKTPHHAECWKYVGMLDVYACNGKRWGARATGPGLARLVGALLLTAFIVAIVILRSRDRKRTAMLRRVAERFGGALMGEACSRSRGWSSRSPAAGDGWNSTAGANTTRRGPGSRSTPAVTSPGVLHIMKEGFGHSILKFFGAQDIAIGDRKFDSDYVIKAKPESLAGRLFSRSGSDLIRTVRRLEGSPDPTFDLDEQMVSVTVRNYLREELAMVTLIEAARDFCGSPGAPVPAGIVMGEVQVAAGGACPVCGTTMAEGVVRCESCRTPHHRECWTYMGRCSTYACKGRRSVA